MTGTGQASNDRFDDCLVGRDEILFVGGRLETAAFRALVRVVAAPADSAGAWWRYAEWTHRMRLQRVTAGEDADTDAAAEGPDCGWWPADEALLERVRWFGPGGDLEAVRDGAAFRWRFVGPPGALPPAADPAARDLFAERETLRVGPTRTAFLWSPPDAAAARGDARVRQAAAADAGTFALLRDIVRRTGMAESPPMLKYVPLLDHGVIAAAWFLSIDAGPAGTTDRKE